jgi:cyclic-di-GMP-binding protein
MNTPSKRPHFSTTAQCKAWLADTPLTNVPKAQSDLLQQLNLLNLEALPTTERLAILELLRKPILLVQREAARRFAGRALPLAATEQAAFEATHALWQSLQVGYRHCLLAALEDGGAADAALPIARALGIIADSQFDTYRAGYQPGPEHWRVLHELFAAAERLGVVDHEVSDPTRMGRTPFPLRAAYAEALLLHMTSPHELPLRHLAWVGNWARRWSPKLLISATPPALDMKAIPLCVDLTSSEPAGYRPLRGNGARWLDTSALRASLRKRITQLDAGAEPVTLQLGSDCVQPACGILLKQTYRRWCKGGAVRDHERQTTMGKCEVICGVEGVHYYVSGRKPFKQPGYASDDTLRREREEIATFGRIHDRPQDGFSRQQGFQVEQWQVVEEWKLHNESATGVHVSLPASQVRARVSQGQLVALRPEGAQAPLLGQVRWVTMSVDGMLNIGLLIVPGRPQAIAVSAPDIENLGERYRRGFLLPAVASLNTPATVVIPSGWFKSRRELDIYVDRPQRLTLLQLIERGADFDRATYQDLG